MLHGLTVPLLGGSDVVCEQHVAAAEEMLESLRHISAEGQGIFSCNVCSLLDLQTMFIST